MREFVVTLRSGKRYTVRADRVMWDSQFITLRVDPPPSESALIASFSATVALFDRGVVAAVIDRDSLVSDEQGEPIAEPLVVTPTPDGDDPIPF